MSENNTNTIKRPGRPKKKTNIENENKIQGIIDKPTIDNHVLELVYNDPKMFKKVFNMFKGYFVDVVFIHFQSDNISITTKDHTKKTIIYIEIDCNKVIKYYCKFPFKICIKREYLEKVFSTIEKGHNKLAIFSKEKTYQSEIEINLMNDEMFIHDNSIIELSVLNKKDDLIDNRPIIDYSYNDYIIHFSIKSKSFKKFINDALVNNKIFTIEREGNGPLKFKTSYNGKIEYTRSLLNDEMYKINTSMDNDDIFNINLELDYIKPFININISEYVNVYIDNDKKAIFEYIIDNNMCKVSIFNDVYNLI